MGRKIKMQQRKLETMKKTPKLNIVVCVGEQILIKFLFSILLRV